VFDLETLERAATAMATKTRKRTAEKQVALCKVHVVTPTDREKNNELEADLRRMGCLGL
jgi:hypothetical protein